MLVETVGVIVCTHGTVTLPEEYHELTLRASLDPTVIVLLHSGSTPPSLRAIGRLDPLVQDAILTTLPTVLSVTNSRDVGSELRVKLWANVDADSVEVFFPLVDAILSHDVIVVLDLGSRNASKGDKSEQCIDEFHGLLLSADLASVAARAAADGGEGRRDGYGVELGIVTALHVF
tara:strand:- start:67 stop:594 length:528 start_codon:yes stop_codon:yes gene_type:complete